MTYKFTVTKETTQELMQNITDILRATPVLDVVVYPKYQTRTDKQNALFHIWVKEICEQSGLYNNSMFNSKSEAEKYLRRQLYEKACNNGYPYKRKPNGYLLLEDGKPVPMSPGDVSISDFKILLDTTQIFAIDYGFILTER